MIILDPEDQQPSKSFGLVAGPTLRAPERVSTNGPPLPDYETSQAQHWRPPVPPPPKPTSPRYLSKFWRITLYILVIYVALTIAIGVPLIVTSLRHRPGFRPPNFDWDDSPQDSSLSTMMALDAEDCEEWAFLHDDPAQSFFSANVTHHLEASDSLLLQSNLFPDDWDSRNITGSLLVDMNDDPSEDDVVILLTVQSSGEELRTNTRACFREQGRNRGLQIYTPRNRTDHDTMAIALTLLFPQFSEKYNLDDLTTSLPMFEQVFANLSSSVHFRTVTVQGATEAISCTSIDAERIGVSNSLASVSGNFNVTDRLSLDNVEGPINANITLSYTSSTASPPSLNMDTGNSELNAKITLNSASSSHPKKHGMPNFRGYAQNFNGPITLDIGYDGASTEIIPLDFRVTNNQGACDVSLDDHFHGLFEATTKLGSVNLDKRDEADMRLQYDQNTNTVKRGWIGSGTRPKFWDPAVEGMIKVTSSLSAIHLRLGSGRT